MCSFPVNFRGKYLQPEDNSDHFLKRYKTQRDFAVLQWNSNTRPRLPSIGWLVSESDDYFGE